MSMKNTQPNQNQHIKDHWSSMSIRRFELANRNQAVTYGGPVDFEDLQSIVYLDSPDSLNDKNDFYLTGSC